MGRGMDYSVVDPEIRGLCKAINQNGHFETLSSCQGHYLVEDVETSTRSDAAGPYVLIGHDDPETDPALAASLADIYHVVTGLDASMSHHRGVLVKQLYNNVDEATLCGKSSFTVSNPYRPSNVPDEMAEQLSSYGDAVELILHTGAEDGTKLDRLSPDADTVLEDPTHYSSVLDFQLFKDASSRELVAERNQIVAELESYFSGFKD